MQYSFMNQEVILFIIKNWPHCTNQILQATSMPVKRETSTLLYLRPDLVKMDSARNESGVDQKRLSIPNVYTPIWWYADFPNHYAGEGAKATRELGQLITEHYIDGLVQALKTIKADTKTLELQKEFFDKVKTN